MNSKKREILSVLIFFFAAVLIFAGSGFADGLVNGKKSTVSVNKKSELPVLSAQVPGVYADPDNGACGCCGSGSGSGSTDRLVAAENSAVAYYAQKYGGSGNITAKTFDSGCHIEVSLYVDGAFVKKLAVYGDRVTEV